MVSCLYPGMTTRRSLLRLAGGAAGLAAGSAALGALGTLAACTGRTDTDPDTDRSAPRPATQPDALLFVTTTAGLVVLDAQTGKRTLPVSAALATPDWKQVVTAEPDGTGVRVTTRDAGSGQVFEGRSVRDRLTPRAVTRDGRLVALATPNGPAEDGPPGRDKTTIVVADSGGERVRVDLPGNLEPEAFSAEGDRLFVLDYLPPAKPDRYRVRALNLRSLQVEPLSTREKVPVPPGSEETMQGEGRQAVYDPNRGILFTLYTHQPDHVHSRDLTNGGARPGAPHVHAFVHTLNLSLGWAYCIDLPAPFGEKPAAGHAIALGPQSSWLYVVDAGSGSVARIDPDQLTVEKVTKFADQGLPGEASAAITTGNRLVVGAGSRVVTMPVGASAASGEKRELATGGPVRGLALSGDGRIYIGAENAVAAYDLGAGREVHRIPVPGLVAVRHLRRTAT